MKKLLISLALGAYPSVFASATDVECNDNSGAPIDIPAGSLGTGFGFSALESENAAQAAVTGLKCETCADGCHPTYTWRSPLGNADYNSPAQQIPGTVPQVWFAGIDTSVAKKVELACSWCYDL
mgnify:CR=1 FL=1